jgi:hypothetical protein
VDVKMAVVDMHVPAEDRADDVEHAGMVDELSEPGLDRDAAENV